MSSANSRSVLFGSVYALFYLYWNYNCDRQQNRLTSSVALSLQKNVYVKLREKYENNKWNLKELNWICIMINIGSSLVDPYEF